MKRLIETVDCAKMPVVLTLLGKPRAGCQRKLRKLRSWLQFSFERECEIYSIDLCGHQNGIALPVLVFFSHVLPIEPHLAAMSKPN